jgi:hypothetical protein
VPLIRPIDEYSVWFLTFLNISEFWALSGILPKSGPAHTPGGFPRRGPSLTKKSRPGRPPSVGVGADYGRPTDAARVPASLPTRARVATLARRGGVPAIERQGSPRVLPTRCLCLRCCLCRRCCPCALQPVVRRNSVITRALFAHRRTHSPSPDEWEAVGASFLLARRPAFDLRLARPGRQPAAVGNH